MEVAGPVDLGAALVADQPTDVLQRRVIRDAGAEQLGPMVVEHVCARSP
jgi:hypothetical protein